MEVKELLSVIHPLCDPKVVVYDLVTDKETIYNWIDLPDFGPVLNDFGERVVAPKSVMFGEDPDNEFDKLTFLHLVVE